MSVYICKYICIHVYIYIWMCTYYIGGGALPTAPSPHVGAGLGSGTSASRGTSPFIAHVSGTFDSSCMARIRQSRPDSGLGFQLKVLKTFQLVLLSRGSPHVRAGPGPAASASRGTSSYMAHVSHHSRFNRMLLAERSGIRVRG